jgi:hypothetical protein
MAKKNNNGSGDPDARLKRSDEDSRLSASADRTATEERDDDDDAFDVLLDDWSFDKLPELPNPPGYKCIWLSTTHPQDSIPRRMRLGYVPVTVDEVPNLKQLAVREGEYAGLIACNEMLAFKIDERRWKKIMTRFHHDMPLSEELGIKEKMEELRGKITEKGGRVMMEEGTEALGKARRPSF